jgi:hypothetical protein
MKTLLRRYSIGAATSILVFSAALACGDKLVALGGGVPFDRIHSDHPGNVLLYLNPGSRLNAANNDLRLDRALARAGHTVHSVATRDDLERAMQGAEADVVLMDWADAMQLNAQLTDKVPTLPVNYGGSAGNTVPADAHGRCIIDADKRRAIVLVRAVNSIVEGHEKGLPIDCARIGGRSAA